MGYSYVMDSYAWVEYFRGTKEGETVRSYIEKGGNATCSITIAELAEKYKRENKAFEEDYFFIVSKSKIIDLDPDTALRAGEINFENKKKIKNWGMADSIILATAEIFNVKVVTGDEHFRNLNSVMIN